MISPLVLLYVLPLFLLLFIRNLVFQSTALDIHLPLPCPAGAWEALYAEGKHTNASLGILGLFFLQESDGVFASQTFYATRKTNDGIEFVRPLLRIRSGSAS